MMPVPHPRNDPRNLEIRTKSVEQTLVPLVTQISSLVNHREKYNSRRSEKNAHIMMKVGASVQNAVERFVTVGETIADENPEIQPEMFDACSEARQAGHTIAVLSSQPPAFSPTSRAEPPDLMDKHLLVRSSRQLLSSVTRVLLLADRVVVKKILRAEDKVAYSLTRLENAMSFTDFVQIFSNFGREMVDLAHKTGERQHDLKSERRRAQMQIARSVLEKYTTLLLSASKTLLRHPACDSARHTRDGVFIQVRLALQLLALCVCDGIVPYDPARYFVGALAAPPDTYLVSATEGPEPVDICVQVTANVAVRQLLETLEMVRMTRSIGPGVRERLQSAMDAVYDSVQDFTDSAFTEQHHREQVLDLIDESRFELAALMKTDTDMHHQLNVESIDSAVHRISKNMKDLRKQLQMIAMDQVSKVFRDNEDHKILASIKTASVSGDIDGVEHFIQKYHEHSTHIQEVSRLLHHISVTDALHVLTGHAERNLKALAPLIILSGRTLSVHPSSRIACQNLESFCDTWAKWVDELAVLAKDSDAACYGRVAAEKSAYMSLPKPGKHGKMIKPVKPVVLDVQDQQKIAKVGLEMKLLTSEVDAEAEKWDEYSENDIVQRAKAMTAMAYNMYMFTRGDGPLKTTHDLFTQAEFFAEDANKMYKVVRDFSFEVPGSQEKNELLLYLEKIPSHCQQLQVLVKSPTVGKTATFGKVDSVIQETKNLMNEVSKLVTHCFICATKFEIEFRSTGLQQARSGSNLRDLDRDASLPPQQQGQNWRRSVSRRSASQYRSSDSETRQPSPCSCNTLEVPQSSQSMPEIVAPADSWLTNLNNAVKALDSVRPRFPGEGPPLIRIRRVPIEVDDDMGIASFNRTAAAALAKQKNARKEKRSSRSLTSRTKVQAAVEKRTVSVHMMQMQSGGQGQEDKRFGFFKKKRGMNVNMMQSNMAQTPRVAPRAVTTKQERKKYIEKRRRKQNSKTRAT